MDSQEVAKVFVRRYYNVLDQSPQDAHKFYSESSVLTWPDTDATEGGVMTSVTTRSAISDKILASAYKDFTVEIKTVDSQASHDGGVVVAVTGAFINKNKVKSNFFQTFFLAKQEKCFIVLNDILRVCEPSGPAANSSYVGSNVCDSPTPSVSTKAASESDVSVVSVDSVAKVPVVEPASNGHAPSVVDSASTADLAAALPAASATLPPVTELASEVKLAPVNVPSASKSSSNGNTVAPNGSPTKSYAFAVTKLVPNSPRSAPVTPKVLPPLTNGAPKPSGQQKKAVPEITRARPEFKSVYVGDLPLEITKHDVANALRAFGAIRRNTDSIQIRRFQDGYCCAFVEFESGDSASKAVEKGQIKFVGHNISYIAFKKGSFNRGGARSPTRGGQRNTNTNEKQSGNGKAGQASGSETSRSPTRAGSRNGDDKVGQERGYQQNKSSNQGQSNGYQQNKSSNQGQSNGYQQNKSSNQGQANGYQQNKSSNQGQANGSQQNKSSNQGQANGSQQNKSSNQGQANGSQQNKSSNQGQARGAQQNKSSGQGAR